MRRTVVTTIAWALVVTGCASGMNNLCSVYGTGNDAVVYEDELAIGLYEDWDANDDGVLSRDEFASGVDGHDAFSDWSGYFDDWDADADGLLGEQEFTAGFMDANVFSGWDTDDSGYLDASECEAVVV